MRDIPPATPQDLKATIVDYLARAIPIFLAVAIPLFGFSYNNHINLIERLIVIENNQARTVDLPERMAQIEQRANSFQIRFEELRSDQKRLRDFVADNFAKCTR